MSTQDFNIKDYWRAIVLYGQNKATYKIALAQSLFNFVEKDKSTIKMIELAEDFFDLYKDRIANGMPQLNMANRITVMEKIIQKYNLGKLDRNAAIEKVAQNAFNCVCQDKFA